MYLLVNETAAISYTTVGKVVSCHRTIAAAMAAEKRLQKAIKRKYGLGYRLTTSIRRPKSRRIRPGDMVYIDETELVSPEELAAE